MLASKVARSPSGASWSPGVAGKFQVAPSRARLRSNRLGGSSSRSASITRSSLGRALSPRGSISRSADTSPSRWANNGAATTPPAP